MKKSCLILFVLAVFSIVNVFAQTSDDEVEVVEPSFSYMSALSFQWSPVIKAKADDGSGSNHFAPITGVNIPIPFFQFVAQYKVPLDFGDSVVVQGANISFVTGPTITPVSFDNQLGVIFTPTPVLSFGLAATAGTGWSIGDSHGIGKYRPQTNDYKANTPFATWKYDFVFQTQFQFDFGFLIPSRWAHIVISATEQIFYEAHSNAKKTEPWEWMGGKDNVNGFQQAGSVVLGYTIPDTPLKLLGLAFAWQNHLSGSDYGQFDSNYNGSFTTLSLSLQSALTLSEKDILSLGLSLFNRRAFLEQTKPDESLLTKTASGREWCFSGLAIQWVHEF